MAQFEYWMTTDLKHGSSQVHALHGQTFTQDNLGNRVGVIVLDDGIPATLNGIVTGYVIRADGGTVVVTGTVDGNKAYIDLPESAYAVPGQIQVAIQLISGETKTVLGALNAYVRRTATGTIIDPGSVVPDLSDLLAQIENARTAATDALYAANAANAAATRAENIMPDVTVEQIAGNHYKIVIDNADLPDGRTRTRKIILVSDSYGEGIVSLPAPSFYVEHPWPTLVPQYLNRPEIAFYTAIHGGFSFSGWVGLENGVDQYDESKQFKKIFDSGIGVFDFTDHQYHDFALPTGISASEITDIYVFAGRNDFSADMDSASDRHSHIVGGIQAFITACATKFPNAQVAIGMIGGISKDGWFYGRDESKAEPDGLYNYWADAEVKRMTTADLYSECSRYGARYIANCDAILRDTEYMSGDGIHPDASGHEQLAQFIANTILSEGISINRQRSYSATPESGWSLYGGGTIYVDEVQSNQRTSISTRAPMTLTRSTGMTITPGTRIKLFQASNTCFSGDQYIRAGTTATIVFYDTSENAYVSRNSIEFAEGWVQLYIEGLKMDGTYQGEMKNIYRVYLPTLTLNA